MKRLFRSRRDVKIAGVCGGVAEYFNIDSTIIRILWVILSFMGAGLLAYFICAIIIPQEPKDYDERRDDDVVDYRDN